MTNHETSEETKNNWHNDPSNWVWEFSILIQKTKDCFLQKESNKWDGRLILPTRILFFLQ